MPTINLTITAQAPLTIGRNKPGGNVSETERYIPGGVIRGAIASTILRQAKAQGKCQSDDLSEENGDFQSLFLDEDAAIFRNAYPAIAKDGPKAEPLSGDILVLPATALSAKTNSGFKGDGDRNEGVFDSLIDRFCAEALGLPYDFSSPSDGGRVEPYSGFYHPGAPAAKSKKSKKGKSKPQSAQKAQSTSVTSRLLTRVGINRRRATAEDAMLYALEVLDETQGKNNRPTQFHSSIEVANDQLANDLTAYINHQRFRLGGSSSRGLGKVRIKASNSPAKRSVNQRIEQFNSSLRQRWRDWCRICPDLAHDLNDSLTYFTLDLQSDAIFTEQWRSTTVLTPAMLNAILLAATGATDETLCLEVAHSSYAYSSGWNSAWGLMKDVDVVTNKGGCYFFSTEQPKLWSPVWQQIEARGVGDRTPEGFGQLLICHPFHSVFREKPL